MMSTLFFDNPEDCLLLRQFIAEQLLFQQRCSRSTRLPDDLTPTKLTPQRSWFQCIVIDPIVSMFRAPYYAALQITSNAQVSEKWSGCYSTTVKKDGTKEKINGIHLTDINLKPRYGKEDDEREGNSIVAITRQSSALSLCTSSKPPSLLPLSPRPSVVHNGIDLVPVRSSRKRPVPSWYVPQQTPRLCVPSSCLLYKAICSLHLSHPSRHYTGH